MLNNSLQMLARSHGAVSWLRQMAHDQEVVGSNPGIVCWMGVSYYVKEKLKIKVPNGAHQKNILKKWFTNVKE